MFAACRRARQEPALCEGSAGPALGSCGISRPRGLGAPTKGIASLAIARGNEPPRAGRAARLNGEPCATRWDLAKCERAKGTNALLLIKLAAVSDPDHDDLLEAIVDLIAYPPVADADSPDAFCASNLEASGRAGIGS